MAVPFSNTKLRVPKGFQNVLEGLAREVLRCQPENIYSFSAAYFEELLRKRQETGFDDITLLGAKLEDRFYNNHSFKIPNSNTNNDDQQSAAVVIQSEYRRFAAKKEVDNIKEEEAATVIQASFRGHHERNIIRTMENGEKASNAALINEENSKNQSNEIENSEEQQITVNQNNISDVTQEEFNTESQNLLTETNEDDELEHQHTPKDVAVEHCGEIKENDTIDTTVVEIMEFSTPKENDSDLIDIDLEDPDVEKAALKIQSVFKGFKSRKKEPIKEEPKASNEEIAEVVVPVKEVELVELEVVEPVVDPIEEEPEEVPCEMQTIVETLDEDKKPEIEEIIDRSLPRPPEDEVIDIDLQDPEVEKAALKIQSVFKGFSGRKRIKPNNEVTSVALGVEVVNAEPNLITEEIEEESKKVITEDTKEVEEKQEELQEEQHEKLQEVQQEELHEEQLEEQQAEHQEENQGDNDDMEPGSGRDDITRSPETDEQA